MRRRPAAGAGFQHVLGVLAHRIVAGAFEHGVEAVTEEMRGVVGNPARRRFPLRAHQHRRHDDARRGAAVDRREQMSRDRAMADQAELHASSPSSAAPTVNRPDAFSAPDVGR